MRIYKVNIEHVKFGTNFSSMNVSARTCEEAVRKANSRKNSSQERVEAVHLVAEAD